MTGKTLVQDGWQWVRLGDVAEVKSGIGFPLNRQGRRSGDYPFIKVSDMTLEGNENYILTANNYVDEQDATELRANIFLPGAVVFPKVGAAIATNKKRALTAPTIIDNNMVGITVSNDGRCDARFLHNWFESVDIARFANVSAVPSITTARLKEELILLPPLKEQRSIAAVLDSIDDAIGRTGAVIAATEQLRGSLLHQLLTRGVSGCHTEWKEVPGLGTIPADWEVVRLGDRIEEGPTNGIYKPESEYGRGACLIRIDDFAPGALVRREGFKRIQVTEEEVHRYSVREGDILINRVNSLSHLGKAVLIPHLREPTLFESNMMMLRMDSSVHPKFAEMVVLSDNARRHFKARAKKAVQQVSINQQDVIELLSPVPGLAEQQAIVAMVDGVDEALMQERHERERLQTLKASTADALLTGRLKVNVHPAKYHLHRQVEVD